MSRLFYSLPLLNLAVCGKAKNPENVLSRVSITKRTLLQGPPLRPPQLHIQAHTGQCIRLWETRRIEKPVQGTPEAMDRRGLFSLSNCLYFHKGYKLKANLSPTVQYTQDMNTTPLFALTPQCFSARTPLTLGKDNVWGMRLSCVLKDI